MISRGMKALQELNWGLGSSERGQVYFCAAIFFELGSPAFAHLQFSLQPLVLPRPRTPPQVTWGASGDISLWWRDTLAPCSAGKQHLQLPGLGWGPDPSSGIQPQQETNPEASLHSTATESLPWELLPLLTTLELDTSSVSYLLPPPPSPVDWVIPAPSPSLKLQWRHILVPAPALWLLKPPVLLMLQILTTPSVKSLCGTSFNLRHQRFNSARSQSQSRQLNVSDSRNIVVNEG